MLETAKPNTKTEPTGPGHQQPAESRLDPITGNWTVFAPHRGQRPEEFVHDQDRIKKRVECPFCPGNESTTPPAVWIGRVSEDDSGLDILSPSEAGLSDATNVLCAEQNCTDTDWSVRVVPNKFPAVGPSAQRPHEKAPSNIEKKSQSRDTPLFESVPLTGGHEVVIESRNHVQSFTELDVSEAQLVFQAYRDRLQYWRSIPGIAYVSTFKNVGGKAGASLRHTHSQMIATDRIPPAIGNSVDRMIRYRANRGCCLHCDMVRAELKAKQRIVWRDGSLIAYCPFASNLPMLIRITTLDHQPCYEDLDDGTIESVSRLVGRVVSWLEKLRPGTAYNFCLHTRPPGANDTPDAYHWSIEIFPRMTQVAGFEWSSQCMINPMLPEQAASKLRSCALAEDPRVML
ncbi:MAG: galactose-1-phosphate uridylyltransferase [Rubripirellula sp.]